MSTPARTRGHSFPPWASEGAIPAAGGVAVPPVPTTPWLVALADADVVLPVETTGSTVTVSCACPPAGLAHVG